MNDPKTLAERNKVATTCSSKLAMTLPMVVDDLQDTVNMAYGAWPERMFVLTAAGKIAYKGGIGPWGFKTAETRVALENVLAK